MKLNIKDGEYGLLFSGGLDSTAAYHLLENQKKFQYVLEDGLRMKVNGYPN